MATKVLIAGSGGQGILFMGKVLAQCAMIADWNVTWMPSYGAEMRGGTANCTVIISRDIIGSPVIKNPDVLVVMNQASAVKFEPRLKGGGLLVFDSDLVEMAEVRSGIEVYGLPASSIAASLGKSRVANMVMLGGVLKHVGLFGEECAESALRDLTPAGKRDILYMNLDALMKGLSYNAYT